MKTPAELVDEIMELADSETLSDAERDRCRHLGHVLLSTPGTTPLDALGFSSIAAYLVSNAIRQHGEGFDVTEELGTIAGYVARTVEALQASTLGAEAPSNTNLPMLH